MKLENKLFLRNASGMFLAIFAGAGLAYLIFWLHLGFIPVMAIVCGLFVLYYAKEKAEIEARHLRSMEEDSKPPVRKRPRRPVY